MPSGQQLHIAPGRRGVDGDSLLGAKAQQIVRSVGFGAGAAQAFAAKGLDADHGAERIDLRQHRLRIALPAHDVQHRAEVGRDLGRVAGHQLARGTHHHLDHRIGNGLMQAQQAQRRAALPGVCSAGLASTVLPVTRAAATWPTKMASGKFQGLMQTQGPS